MALGASVLAFVFACAAAGMTLYLGFSAVIAVLAYAIVGAFSLLVAVVIADARTNARVSVSDVAGHKVTS